MMSSMCCHLTSPCSRLAFWSYHYRPSPFLHVSVILYQRLAYIRLNLSKFLLKIARGAAIGEEVQIKKGYLLYLLSPTFLPCTIFSLRILDTSFACKIAFTVRGSSGASEAFSLNAPRAWAWAAWSRCESPVAIVSKCYARKWWNYSYRRIPSNASRAERNKCL